MFFFFVLKRILKPLQELFTIFFPFFYYCVVDVDESIYTFHVLMLLINNLYTMMRISQFVATFKVLSLLVMMNVSANKGEK